MLSAMTWARDGRLTAAALKELERHEIVGGELVQKASPTFAHGAAQISIGVALGGFRGHGRPGHPGGWWLGAEVEIELAPHEVYLPDIAGWRIDRMPEPPRERPVRVAPDWVCEILSPSTADRDRGHKQRMYHLARVRHYWVAEPASQKLTVYRWQEGNHAQVMSARAGEVARVEPFDAVALDIGDMFGAPARAQ